MKLKVPHSLFTKLQVIKSLPKIKLVALPEQPKHSTNQLSQFCVGMRLMISSLPCQTFVNHWTPKLNRNFSASVTLIYYLVFEVQFLSAKSSTPATFESHLHFDYKKAVAIKRKRFSFLYSLSKKNCKWLWKFLRFYQKSY